MECSITKQICYQISQFWKARVLKFFGGPLGYLGGVLAPSSHGSTPIEIPLTSAAGFKNDINIVTVATVDLTNSTYLKIN